jgi:hypothetical protein
VDSVDGIVEETLLREYRWMEDWKGYGNRQRRLLWTRVSMSQSARRLNKCRLWILDFGFRFRCWCGCQLWLWFQFRLCF